MIDSFNILFKIIIRYRIESDSALIFIRNVKVLNTRCFIKGMVTKYRKMEKFKNPKSKIVFLPLKVILHIYPSPPFQQQQHHYFIRSPPPIFFTRHSITQLHPPFALYLSFHPIIFFPPPSLFLSLSLFFLPGKQANGNWRVDGDAAVIRKLLSGPPPSCFIRSPPPEPFTAERRSNTQ